MPSSIPGAGPGGHPPARRPLVGSWAKVTAAGAARVGGKILLRYFGRLDPSDIDLKARNDFVSRADRESERAIREYLRDRHPTHALLGEEEEDEPHDDVHRGPV